MSCAGMRAERKWHEFHQVCQPPSNHDPANRTTDYCKFDQRNEGGTIRTQQAAGGQAAWLSANCPNVVSLCRRLLLQRSVVVLTVLPDRPTDSVGQGKDPPSTGPYPVLAQTHLLAWCSNVPKPV